MDTGYILFLIDGECTFCNRLIVWILKRRKENNIRFFPLQSRTSINFLTSVGVTGAELMNSSYLVTQEGVLHKSRAFFRLTTYLKGGYSLLRFFRIMPVSVSDLFYDLIARNRYRIFGKENSFCEFAHHHYSRFMLTEDEASIYFETIRRVYDQNE